MLAVRPLRLDAIPWRRAARPAALIALVVLAYNYSLLTLWQGLALQSPLADLGLVPLIALALGWVYVGREPAQPPIHDRQLDYILGIAFILVAVAILVLLPGGRAGFWLQRMDLVSLPFFVAGLIALLYGTRRLWTLRVPVAYLVFAWPALYAPLVGDGMRAFADVTAAAVARLSALVPLGVPVSADNSLFLVQHGGSSFVVSVGAACSGVNGLVSYLLIGAALGAIVSGALVRRLAWLVSGLALVWVLNVIRIELLLGTGAAFGEQAAIGLLHPVAGLLLFTVAVLAMLVTAGRFGLGFDPPDHEPPAIPRHLTDAVRTLRAPLITATALALVIGVADAGLVRYETIAGGLGDARIVPLAASSVHLAGWQSSFVASYSEARQFFGSTATWNRVLYSADRGASPWSSVPIYMDVIDTPDSGALAAYGLDACYQFHGYRIEAESNITIVPGITGQVIDYRNVRAGTDWSAVWWEWPDTTGTTTAYERIVVFVSDGPGGSYGRAPAIAPVAAPAFQATDDFLAAFARAIAGGHVRSASA